MASSENYVLFTRQTRQTVLRHCCVYSYWLFSPKRPSCRPWSQYLAAGLPACRSSTSTVQS